MVFWPNAVTTKVTIPLRHFGRSKVSLLMAKVTNWNFRKPWWEHSESHWKRFLRSITPELSNFPARCADTLALKVILPKSYSQSNSPKVSKNYCHFNYWHFDIEVSRLRVYTTTIYFFLFLAFFQILKLEILSADHASRNADANKADRTGR